jgi:hypothetical protein
MMTAISRVFASTRSMSWSLSLASKTRITFQILLGTVTLPPAILFLKPFRPSPRIPCGPAMIYSSFPLFMTRERAYRSSWFQAPAWLSFD